MLSNWKIFVWRQFLQWYPVYIDDGGCINEMKTRNIYIFDKRQISNTIYIDDNWINEMRTRNILSLARFEIAMISSMFNMRFLLNQMRKRNICFSNAGGPDLMEVLLGAYVFGKWYTCCRHPFKSIFVAMKTSFVWTVVAKFVV